MGDGREASHGRRRRLDGGEETKDAEKRRSGRFGHTKLFRVIYRLLTTTGCGWPKAKAQHMGLVEKPVNRFLVRKVENSRAEGTPDAAHRAAPVLGKISPVTALPKGAHRPPPGRRPRSPRAACRVKPLGTAPNPPPFGQTPPTRSSASLPRPTRTRTSPDAPCPQPWDEQYTARTSRTTRPPGVEPLPCHGTRAARDEHHPPSARPAAVLPSGCSPVFRRAARVRSPCDRTVALRARATRGRRRGTCPVCP